MRFRERACLRAGIPVVFALAFMTLVTSTFLSTRAEAVLFLEPQDHWKYNVEWTWKPSLHKTVGLIDSQIIVQNETTDKIEGYVADANGTRLTMFGPEQIVQVKYVSKDGFSSEWRTVGRTHDGFFAFDIPLAHRNAPTVGIFIGSNSYYVNMGRLSQPLVLIDSARLDYERLSLDQTTIPTTVVTAAAQSYSPDSLIDTILQMFGLSPVGGAYSSK